VSLTRGALPLLVAVALLAPARGAAPGADPEAAVQVESALSAPRAVQHEQLRFDVIVTHPVRLAPRWEPPSFEGFWAEPLPSEGTPMRYRGGLAERTTHFRRALFPTRSGALRIAPSRLWLTDAQGGESALEVAGAAVQVQALPGAGRPAGFSGLVGEFALRVALAAPSAEQGAALQLHAEIFGDANVWDAPAPDVASWLGAQAEVFAAGGERVATERSGRLSSRRSFHFEIVPLRAGWLEIPAWELSGFDPRSQSYRVRRSEMQRIAVRPSSNGVATPALPPAPAVAPLPEPRSLPLPPLAAVLAGGLGLLLGLAVVLGVRRRRPPLAAAPPAGPEPRLPRHWLEAAERELDPLRFCHALLGALRAELALRGALDAASLTARELCERTDDPRARALLEALERARFRRDPPDRAALLGAARSYLGEL
jgi:hypothetical protein